MGTLREMGVSAWHERTMCLVFKWWALKKGRRPRVARFEILCQVVARRDRGIVALCCVVTKKVMRAR